MAARATVWPETRDELLAMVRPAFEKAGGSLSGAAELLGKTEAQLQGALRHKRISRDELRGDRAPVAAPVSYPPSTVEPDGKPPANSEPPPLIDWTGARPQSTGAGLERRIILGDLHVPYHDLRACAAALAVIRALQPHRVIQMGDLWNMGAIDHHPPPFGGRENHASAMRQGRAFLEAVRKAAPGAELTVLLGNHDEYAYEMEDANPQYADLFVPDWLPKVADVLVPRAPEPDVPHIIGPIGYLHGYGGGEFSAKKYAIEVGPKHGLRHVRAAHHHQIQRFYARTGCEVWLVGWLGNKRHHTFNYLKNRGSWEVGLLVDDVYGEHVTTTPVRLDGGAALVGGRLIAA